MVVLARSTAPASRRRAAGGPSSAAGRSVVAAVPSGSGKPRVAMFSLMVTGTPSSGPSGAPSRQRASEAAAWASAASGSAAQVACRCGSQHAMWASTACTTSVGEKRPRA